MDKKSAKAAAFPSISALRQRLETESRFREARALIYFEFGCAENNEVALEILQSFAQALDPNEWPVEKAMTLIDIGQLQMQSEDAAVKSLAHETLAQARQILDRVRHGYGSTDIDLILIDADESLSAGEKFVRKTHIADKYSNEGHYRLSINCLIHSITPQLSVESYHDSVIKAMETLENQIESTGGEILKQLSLIHAVAQSSVNSSEYGFALQSLETYLFHNLPEEIGFKFHSSLYHVLASVYASFGQHQKAITAAEKSLSITESGYDYEDKSDAAFHLGHRLWNAAQDSGSQNSETTDWLARSLTLIEDWVERDANHGYKEGEMQKCLHIARCNAGQDLENQDAEALARAQDWIRRTRDLASEDDIPLQDQILSLETQILSLQGKYAESFEKSSAFLQKVLDVGDVPILTKAQAMVRASIQADIYGRAGIESLQSKENVTFEEIKPSIQLRGMAVDMMFQAVRLFRQTNGVEITVTITNTAFGLLNNLLPLLGDAGEIVVTQFLGELEQTEKICDDMRRSVIPISGIKSLMVKRLLVAKKASIDLYRHGVTASLRIGDASRAWAWLQKSKARAFNDSLGAHSVVPEALLRRINEDPAASTILKEEQAALELLSEPQVNYVLAARRLAETRMKMAQNPLLSEALRLRDETLRINEDLGGDMMKERLRDSELSLDKVAFVDWYVPSPGKYEGSPIVLFCRRLDGKTDAKTLPMSASQVRDWKRNAFEYPDMATPPLARKTGNRLLHEMNPLLEGLTDYTADGDLLVLSPSGLLNGIPLHGLKVKGQRLLERNMVIYSSSTATLCQCLSRAYHQPASSHHATEGDSVPFHAQYLSAYEEPLKQDERSLIFDHLAELTTRLPGDVSCGPQATKDRFLRAASEARWVHYHGHARYDAADVLKSSLVLSNGKDVFAPDCAEDEDGIDELDVLRLFDAQFPRGGAHYTIIACDSGTQHVGPGDEPLGIIPALLHAGATSVLGCLWPIESRSGRIFSNAFYNELPDYRLEHKDADFKDIFQLARAAMNVASRMATGELGDEFKQPYHWAPFGLFGLWYLPI
jgi:CHAT domain-containing protein